MKTRAAMLLLVWALGLAWLGWPVWDSLGSPSPDDLRAEFPALLAALMGLVLVLGWTQWRSTGGRLAQLTPVVLCVALDTMVRLILSPGRSGVELVHALPLLAGAALGAVPGFLVGALSCLASSVALGLVDTPLPAQVFAWGLWGTVGGLLRQLPTVWAWLGAMVVSLPVGVLSGVLFNVQGWPFDGEATVGAFVPGATAGASLGRLWDYTLATSLGVDLVRGLTTVAVVALVGLPVLTALRAPTHQLPAVSTTDPLRQAADQRRARNTALEEFWNPAPPLGETP